MSRPESQNCNSIRSRILTLDVTVGDSTKYENGVMFMQLLGFDNSMYLYVYFCEHLEHKWREHWREQMFEIGGA